MFLGDQFSPTRSDVNEVGVLKALTVLLHRPVLSIISPDDVIAVIARTCFRHARVGQLRYAVACEIVDRAASPTQLHSQTNLLHRLYIVVFPGPEVHGELFVGRSVVWWQFRLWSGRCAEEDPLSTSGHRNRRLV